jgi:hypothetical protein
VLHDNNSMRSEKDATQEVSYFWRVGRGREFSSWSVLGLATQSLLSLRTINHLGNTIAPPCLRSPTTAGIRTVAMSAEASTSQQESFVGQMVGGVAILTTADRIGPSEYHHFMCIFRPV